MSTQSDIVAKAIQRYPGSVRCRKPKMTGHRGATWDRCTVIDVFGVEISGYLDTSWGLYFYFPYGQDGDSCYHWRKAKNDIFMNSPHFDYSNTADFRIKTKE